MRTLVACALGAVLLVAAAPARAQLQPLIVPIDVSVLVVAAEQVAQASAAEARRLERERAAARRRAALLRLRRSRTVVGALKRARLHGALSETSYALLRAEYDAARRTLRALDGTPRAELAAVLATLEALAARRQLTTTRLPAAFLVLRHNARAWARGAVPAPAARQVVDDGTVVLQYYPGQGLQLQPLASWGRANALARACLEAVRAKRPCRERRLRAVLDRLVGLASRRSGYLAWEHFFAYGGGTPPWVSGMTQATAVQALARAARALGDGIYATAADAALGAFEQPPPAGVAVPERGGSHFLMYSFAPGLRIFNGGLQAVSGLRDAAALLRSRRARRLFRAGDRAARRAVAAADTGAWSRYSEDGRESTLGYHQLTREFLGRLCDTTAKRTYCAAERRYARYEIEPPEVVVRLAGRLRARRPVSVRVWISKISTVTWRLPGAAPRTYTLPRGTHSLPWTPPRRGRYALAVTARSLSGPPARVERDVHVVLPKPKPKPKRTEARRAKRREAQRKRS